MQKPDTYVPYHVHSMLSNGTTNIDSITNFRDYIDAAKQDNISAFGISEHGNIFEWVHKKEYIEAAGMKYLHCVEVYLTEDGEENIIYTAMDLLSNNRIEFEEYWERDDGGYVAQDSEKITHLIDISTLKKEYLKTRDNYHCILIAKNYDGVKELNLLTSKAYKRNDFHFYYMPRITFNELFQTSSNIIITTACLGGVLNNGNPIVKEKMLGFLINNKDRCFLEIQHHNCEEQKEYNKLLYELSREINIPLIAGTDTHEINEEHMDGRAMLQKSKNVYFSNEDDWDLTFKTTEELISAYIKQNVLPIDVIYEAINNTVKLADMVEPFKLDYSPKYPKLYEDSEKVFKHKINCGVLNRNIMQYPNYQEYLDRIYYEYDTYKHNNAIDFMLLEEDYKTEMRKRNVKFGYSRGSVSGSVIAYLLGITEVDSVKFNLNFERFMNKERVSLADYLKGRFYILSQEETIKLYNEYYLKGISTCKMAKIFGHSHHYYLDSFKKFGLPIRSNRENSRKYMVNHNYFENINTYEKAYWLGFIYADGYVSNVNGNKKFGISLGIKDREHLEKLKKCLDATYPIKNYIQKSGYLKNSEYCRLLISSEKIYDDLVRHGVFPHKTNILSPPNIAEQFYPAFILGYFDGDGSIFLNNDKSPFYTINIVGTDKILNFIHTYLKSKSIINRNINLEKRKEHQIVSYIRYGGNQLVSKILDELYRDVDSDLPLKRKKDLYLKCKNKIFI